MGVVDYCLEQAWHSKGVSRVAGVDEAGRGPLAGPVVVAAVVLDANRIPEGLNDSKKLSEKRRNALFSAIMTSADVAIVSAPPSVIFSRNIRGATLWAMTRAVQSLAHSADAALIDGRDVPPGLECPAQAVVKGDSTSLSIAAASIVAKVMRDRMCLTMDREAPAYGFAAHKGYGTAAHIEALHSVGVSAHHRRDFAPVRELC